MMKLLCLALLLVASYTHAQSSGGDFIKDVKALNYKDVKNREAVEKALDKYVTKAEPSCPLVDPKDATEAQNLLGQVEKEAGVTCPELANLIKGDSCVVGQKKSAEVSFLEAYSTTSSRLHRRAFIKGRSQTKAGLGQFFSACVACLTANKLADGENPVPDCNGPDGKPYDSLASIRKDYKRQATKNYTPPTDEVVNAWKDNSEDDVKKCEEAAHKCYHGRHLARINARKCMDKLGFWQTLARVYTNIRDLCVYGDVDGPSEEYLTNEAKKKCTTGTDLAKRLCICKEIIGSSGRTNEKYNKMMKAE